MAVDGLTSVRGRIAAAAERAGRSPESIRLVVVTKAASDDEVEELIAAGAEDFGENRAGPMVDRANRFADVRWHFVGRLQGNKVRKVRPVTDLLHSMDRTDLVGYWASEAEETPPVLVQVNVGAEPQKAGVSPEEAPALVDLCARSGVEVRGLMTLPPRVSSSAEARPFFERLRVLRDAIRTEHSGVKHLSMGMSDDFEAAIAEGATVLRVGRAIFDPVEDEG